MRRYLCLCFLLSLLVQAATANPFPASPDPIRDTLEFMQLQASGSTFEPGILQKLQQLKAQSKFFNRALDGSNLAVWIEVEGAITLNSNVLRLSDNYAEKARQCQQKMLTNPNSPKDSDSKKRFCGACTTSVFSNCRRPWRTKGPTPT